MHHASRGTYGSGRVHAELTLGLRITIGHGAIELLMRRARIKGPAREPPAPAPAPDTDRRRPSPAPVQPGWTRTASRGGAELVTLSAPIAGWPRSPISRDDPARARPRPGVGEAGTGDLPTAGPPGSVGASRRPDGGRSPRSLSMSPRKNQLDVDGAGPSRAAGSPARGRGAVPAATPAADSRIHRYGLRSRQRRRRRRPGRSTERPAVWTWRPHASQTVI